MEFENVAENREFYENGQDITICKVVESFDELFLVERLLVVSCCGTPLLSSYHLKTLWVWILDHLDPWLYPRPPIKGQSGKFIVATL